MINNGQKIQNSDTGLAVYTLKKLAASFITRCYNGSK